MFQLVIFEKEDSVFDAFNCEETDAVEMFVKTSTSYLSSALVTNLAKTSKFIVYYDPTGIDTFMVMMIGDVPDKMVMDIATILKKQ